MDGDDSPTRLADLPDARRVAPLADLGVDELEHLPLAGGERASLRAGVGRSEVAERGGGGAASHGGERNTITRSGQTPVRFSLDSPNTCSSKVSVSPGWFDLERGRTRPRSPPPPRDSRRGSQMVAVTAVPARRVRRLRRARTSQPRSAPARVVPLHRAISDPPSSARRPAGSSVHRQPSPRVTRSHSAAVYWRRRLVAAALGLGVLLTAAHAGAALGGTTTTAPERSPHVQQVVVAARRHALVDRRTGSHRTPIRARSSTRSPPRTAAADRAARRRHPVVEVMAGADVARIADRRACVRAAPRAISWGDVASARSSSGAPPLRARSRRDPRNPCTPTRSAGTRRDRDRVAARAR